MAAGGILTIQGAVHLIRGQPGLQGAMTHSHPCHVTRPPKLDSVVLGLRTRTSFKRR